MKLWYWKQISRPQVPTQPPQLGPTRQQFRQMARRIAMGYLGVGSGEKPVYNEDRRILRRIGHRLANRDWKLLRPQK